jgi:hypothetical protein
MAFKKEDITQILIEQVYNIKDKGIISLDEQINKLEKSQNKEKILPQILIVRNAVIKNTKNLQFISKTLNNIINIFDKIVPILNITISILENLPLPTAPAPITTGVILKLSDDLKDLKEDKDIISKKSTNLDTVRLYVIDVHKELQQKINELDNLIKNYFPDSNFSESMDTFPPVEENGTIEPIEIKETSLNNLDVPYKGFTFEIREDKTNKTNIKKRFAVALDNNRVEILKSQSSFTTNLNILIEELKFMIDII